MAERIYREKELALQQRRKRNRRKRFHPVGPKQVWLMVFVPTDGWMEEGPDV